MDGQSPLRKRPRLSQDQARAALLDAGKRLLVGRGLDTGLGLVTLNDAIVESGVPRASAYRVYAVDDADPQVAFRTELLTTYLEGDPLDSRRSAAQSLTEAALGAVEVTDEAELAYLLREVIRVGMSDNFESLMSDPNWKVIGPSMAVTALTDWAPDDLVAAHQSAITTGTSEFIPLYEAGASRSGLTLREPFTWEQFAIMASSSTTAATFFSKYFPDLNKLSRPTGPGGEMQDWTHSAVLVEGLARTMFVARPDAEVSADLTAWDRPRH